VYLWLVGVDVPAIQARNYRELNVRPLSEKKPEEDGFWPV
jgi:hypothetical protein